jgi:hypothetical protein
VASEELRPVEGLASAAFLLAAALWVLALPFAFASGWAWAFALGWGGLSFVLGLPFGVVALITFGRDVSAIMIKALLVSLGALVTTLLLTGFLVRIDVL